MSTRGLDTPNLFVKEEEEEDMISYASSLSEDHSEEEKDYYDRDITSEITNSCNSSWQAQQTKEQHRYLINEYNIQIPDKQQWIASWFEKNQDYYADSNPTRKDVHGTYTYQLSLYGYYKKKTRVGGYGVIFRDPGGKPISASVYSSKGGSYLYYLLKGLRKGLKLAIAYDGLDDGVIVRCNSKRLVRLTNRLFSPPPCRHQRRYSTEKICENCSKQDLLHDVRGREFGRLFRIVKDIKEMSEEFKFNEFKSYCLFNTMRMIRSGNEAAYYLAKHFKNKSKMKPQEFPRALREIMWKDAYQGYMIYSKTVWMREYRQQLWEEARI